MNVIHIIFALEVGGSENMLIDILNEQIQHKKVSLIIINNRVNEGLINRIDERVEIIRLNRNPGNKINFLFLIRLWKILLNREHSVIHCHNYYIIPLIRLWKRKTLITIHSTQSRIPYLKNYQKVISISEAVKNDIYKRGSIFSEVVYNGINFNKFSPKPFYQNLRDQKHIRLIQIGRLNHVEKGQDITLKAIAKLVYEKNISNISISFAGVGSSLEYLQDLTVDLKIEEHVFFLGNKPRSWIMDNLNRFDILVQPSRTEGFGLTIVEALAAGLPVIASDIGGPSEILNSIGSGYLFHTENPESLAEKLVEVIAQPKENLEMQCHLALAKAKEIYSIKETAARYMQHYSSIA